jgi:O-methyltransferase involved in polyketide biosynthesis
VNLGCGLDTTFERVDNGTLSWYDLDLPDVIALRIQYIPEGPRREFIACSVLDDRWMDHVKIADAALFVAAGVLYYFEEAQVKALLSKLADRFPGCELVFDGCSPRGLRIANKKVIEGGGMDASAQLRWGVSKATQIYEWDRRITVLAEFPIFRGLKGALSLKERWGTFLSDTLRIMSMMHLRLGERTLE